MKARLDIAAAPGIVGTRAKLVRETYTEQVHIRMRASEVDYIRRAADKLGVEWTSWLRTLMLAATGYTTRRGR